MIPVYGGSKKRVLSFIIEHAYYRRFWGSNNFFSKRKRFPVRTIFGIVDDALRNMRVGRRVVVYGSVWSWTASEPDMRQIYIKAYSLMFRDPEEFVGVPDPQWDLMNKNWEDNRYSDGASVPIDEETQELFDQGVDIHELWPR